MISLPLLSGSKLRKSFSLALALVFFCVLPLAAESITGVVTNKTNNKAASGDDVVLLKLAQGMQELARTKTNSKGMFTLEVSEPGLHLVRVTHDKANYFRPVPPGTQSVQIDVYSGAAKVDGITQEADVMRIQSEPGGSSLRVVEHYFVKNESTPPKTQFSDRPFELWLPAGAVVEGSAAMAPGGMAVQSPLVPLAEPNHYTLIFPLRPGETQFQVTYKIPYTGSITLAPRPSLPTDTVAIMLPKSMTFKSGPSSPYTAVTEETTAQTYVARHVSPSQPMEFSLTGVGQLPRDSQAGESPGATANAPQAVNGDSPTPAQASESMRNDTKPGSGLGNPLDSQGDLDPWAKYKGWILGGLFLLLAAGAGIMFKTPPSASTLATSPAPAGTVTAPLAPSQSTPGTLLQVLKEELFALETERLQGRLADSEYTQLKSSLEVILRRALARAGSPSSADSVRIVPE